MSGFSVWIFIVNFPTTAFPGASLAGPSRSEEKSDLTTRQIQFRPKLRNYGNFEKNSVRNRPIYFN